LNTNKLTNYVEDIDGTKSKPLTILNKSNRITNPLNPNYSLPSFDKKEDYTPKFIRDTLNVKDINDKKEVKELSTRENLRIDDIEGATRKNKLLFTTKNRDTKDTSNIGHKHKIVKDLNPLNPIYKLRDESNKIIDYGYIEGSKSKKKSQHIIDNHVLKTDDIPGSQVGTLYKTGFKPR